MTTRVSEDISTIHGINILDINNFLASAWNHTVWTAINETAIHDYSSIAISEYKASFVHPIHGETHYHIKFGSPSIKALCDHEAVLYIDLEEIIFTDRSPLNG